MPENEDWGDGSPTPSEWFGHQPSPEPEHTHPGEELHPRDAGVEGEVPNDGEDVIQPKSRKLTVDERKEAVRLVKFYYAIGHNDAQRIVRNLLDSGELDAILDQARQGIKTHRPICPRCSNEMVKRTGKLGEFWGCGNFPNCRGVRHIVSEIKAVTDAQKTEAANKLALAMDYVNAVGGIDEARRWVNIAGVSLGEGKVDGG